VHRFEGTVNQYTGDGIMALFGAPIAHEDHAQRACYAALHLGDQLREFGQRLRREHGLDFNVRFGLNSGEVVVGKIGDDLRMDYTAAGPSVGLAARMQELAEPGRAYLTDTTAAIVSGYFALEDLGEFKVKGVDVPVRVHALLGAGDAQTRLDVSRARGFSRFVGRSEELALLEAALERAARGEGGTVGIIAQAGVGKSRLCNEFVGLVRARGIQVLEAHALPQGRQIPLMPMLQLLRGLFGIEEADTDQQAREKIAGRLLLFSEEFREFLPVVFDMLGVPDGDRRLQALDPDARQHRVFAFLRRLMAGALDSDPLVLLIEDLHWIDEGSAVLLEQVISSVPGTRLLALVNSRPGYSAPWMAGESYEEIRLVPLGAPEIREMLAELLGSDPSVSALADLIAERAGGNPFFVEEGVHNLVAGGHLEGSRSSYRLVTPLDELAIPPTVQAILAARIDRLAERDKRVLQTASVIGRDVPLPVLRAVTGLPDADLAGALRSLVDGEFLYERSLYPEPEYAFRHPLTQEVAYDSQLRNRSTALHAAVARAYEELHAGRSDGTAALLAHHWELGGDPIRAAHWGSRAAQRIASANPAGARDHWRKVLALLDEAALQSDEAETDEVAAIVIEACQNILVLSLVAGIAPQEAQAVYFRARVLAEELEDTRALVFLTAMYGTVVSASTGQLDTQVRHGEESYALAEQTGDPFVILLVSVNYSSALQMTGRFADARAICRRALEGIPEQEAARDAYLQSPFYLHVEAQDAWLQGQMGEPREAIHRLEAVLPAAREQGQVLLEMLVRLWLGDLHAWLGEAQEVMEGARLSLSLAERIGAPMLLSYGLAQLGRAHEVRGEWEEARQAGQHSMDVATDSRTAVWDHAYRLAQVAVAQAALGDLEGARATVAGAHERCRQMGRRPGVAWAVARVLLLAEDPGDGGEIAAALDEYQADIEASGAQMERPLLHEMRAELAAQLGDDAARTREFEEARRLFVGMRATVRAERIDGELGP
jgi:tetratricopeptide (TPR) repeat protein